MIRPRKTKAERERERERKEHDAKRQALVVFCEKLAALKSLSQAVVFAHTPLPNNPGRVPPERTFYDNFADFLGSLSPEGCTVPPDSSAAERSQYLQFIKRVEATGEFKPGDVEKIKRALRNSGAD